MSADAEALRRICQLSQPPRHSHDDQTSIVCLDGRSGSGKTHLAAQAHEATGFPVLSMEDLYVGWSGLRQGVQRFEHQVLTPLASGGAAWYRRYDWHTRALAEAHLINPGGVLIVEGVGSLCSQRPELVTLGIWLQAPAETRRQRVARRDGAVTMPFWQMWQRQEDSLIQQADPSGRADLQVWND